MSVCGRNPLNTIKQFSSNENKLKIKENKLQGYIVQHGEYSRYSVTSGVLQL